MLTAKESEENREALAATCLHCSLPIPQARRNIKNCEEDSQPISPGNFCCSGCDFVYRLLHKHKLTQFYALRDGIPEDQLQAVNPSKSSFAYLDQDDFTSKHVTQTSEGAHCLELTLAGVHCAACVWLIERTPKLLPGLSQARLDFGKNRVRLSYDPKLVSPSKIAGLFDSLGYSPTPFTGQDDSPALRSHERHFLIRLGVSAFCAGNTMMIAVSLYQGMFTGIPESIRTFLHWSCFALTLPVVLYAAWPFYRLGFGGLRMRTLHIDLPISLGIILAFVASTINTLRGAEYVYFDSICMLVFLLLSGRWLQHRRLRKIARGLDLLPSLLPASARRINGNIKQEVLREALKIGDQVEVRADEIIPADGRIIQGSSSLNRALITGESRPVSVEAGDLVIAGTKNLSKPLLIEVEKTEQQTRIGKIIGLVEEASQNRASISALTDRMSGYFVLTVLLLSAGTFAYWHQFGFFEALDNTLALLVITCPCALGLAAPIALSLAISQSAKKGILLRSADAIERVSHVRQVFFDKTGTLTEGNCKVIVSEFFDQQQPMLAAYMLALEQDVEHPVAQAIRDFARSRVNTSSSNIVPSFQTISLIAGKGVSAKDQDGKLWRLGSARFIEEELGPCSAEVQNKLSEISSRALSPVVLTSGDQILAIFGIGDEIKQLAPRLINELRKRDLNVSMISGDAGNSSKAVGEKLGIIPAQVHGELSPEQKMELLKSAQKQSPCMMVGDGVNDAAALALASVGVGISGGAESCLKVADVFLTKSDPSLIKQLFDGSNKVMRLIKFNLALSLVYNILGAAAAMLGLVNPLLAAILMPLSSLTVIITSTSVKCFD